LDDPGISVVGEAERLLAAGGVTALHDPTEGGLATAVREMAIASGCGAVIDQDAVPMLPETVLVAGALGIDPLGLLASGSLLVAAEPAATDRLLGIGAEAGFPITEIGWLAPADQGYRVVGLGAPGELAEFAVDEASRVLTALQDGGRAGAAE
jgi:hydrogenase maturation factor